MNIRELLLKIALVAEEPILYILLFMSILSVAVIIERAIVGIQSNR